MLSEIGVASPTATSEFEIGLARSVIVLREDARVFDVSAGVSPLELAALRIELAVRRLPVVDVVLDAEVAHAVPRQPYWQVCTTCIEHVVS